MCLSVPKPKDPIPPPMQPDEGVQAGGTTQRARVKQAASGSQTIFNIGGVAGLPGQPSTTAKTTTGA